MDHAQPAPPPVPAVLLVGWSSVLHGEATAGDVLAMDAVAEHLRDNGFAVDLAWSAVMAATRGGVGDVAYDDVRPGDHGHVVWVCGPLTGQPVEQVHERFPAARRTAVGVSVLDPDDAAVRGFHVVVPRDAPGGPDRADLAARPDVAALDVVGVFLTHGQGEYGHRRRHAEVTDVLGGWLAGLPEARLDLDTRLDPRDWRSPSTPGQVLAVVSRLDVVVTTRLHGLVLALRCGVPALAVDPVAGGGKVGAQARAWGWPAVLSAEQVLTGGAPALERAYGWCRSGPGRAAARAAQGGAPRVGGDQLVAVLAAVSTPAGGPGAA